MQRLRIDVSALYNWVLYGTLAGYPLILIGLPADTRLASMGVTLVAISNLLALGLLILSFRNETDITKKNDIILLGALILLTFVCCLFGGGRDIQAITKCLTFLQLPIYLVFADRVNVTKVRKWIYLVALVCVVFFLLFSQASFAHRYIGPYGETQHGDLTLGYSNPNETGIHLILCFCIVVSGMFYFRHPGLKILFALAAATLIWLISQTNCRAVAMFAIGLIGMSFLLKGTRTYPALPALAIIAPVVYVLLFTVFPSLQSMVIFGESFDTGRLELFHDTMAEVTPVSFFFGNYSEHTLNNLHNAYLSVFASLGIFSLIAYVALLYRKARRESHPYINKAHFVAYLAFLMLIVHSCMEAAVLTSGSAFAASAFLTIVLINPDQEAPLEG